MHSISYVSTAAIGEELLRKTVASISQTAQTRNAKLGVSGVLIYESGHFFQILEGPESVVSRLFADICADTRHRDVKKLLDAPVPERRFSDCHMATYHVHTPEVLPSNHVATLDALYHAKFGTLSINHDTLLEFASALTGEITEFRVDAEMAAG